MIVIEEDFYEWIISNGDPIEDLINNGDDLDSTFEEEMELVLEEINA